MALRFHAVKRKVPGGPDEGKELFYGQVRCAQPVTLEEMCREIMDHTSVTEADVLVVLDGLTKVVATELAKGNIVQLAGLGNLRVTAGSAPADTIEGVTGAMMKRNLKVTFSPGKQLLQTCGEVSIEKMGIKVIDMECPEDHSDPD